MGAKTKPPGFHPSDFIRLRQLPYLSSWPDEVRAVPVMTFHRGESKFETYLTWEGDELMVLQPLDIGSGGKYIGLTPANPADVPLPLSTVLARHFSTPHILARLREVEADLENAMASIHKYFVILQHANTTDEFTDVPMIRSEIELGFTNHRSMYDQLNKIIGACVKLLAKPKRELPTSFADTLKKTDEDLRAHFGFSEALVRFFRSRESRFKILRDVRDGIVHHGHSNESWIFNFPDGFAADVDRGFLARLQPLNLWPSDVRRAGNDSLGSMLALFAFLLRDLLTVMTDAAHALSSDAAALPPPIIGDQTVFLRSRLSRHVHNVEEYLTSQWWQPSEILRSAR